MSECAIIGHNWVIEEWEAVLEDGEPNPPKRKFTVTRCTRCDEVAKAIQV
jgi:hypothetical protein